MSQTQVREVALAVDVGSESGLDRMAVRWLVLLATTNIVATAGVSRLASLTNVVSSLAGGNIPPAIVPFLSAAALVAVDKGGGNPRPITIGNVLPRLKAKVLMPQAIASTAGYLQPEQVANGVSSGGKAIVHWVRQLMDEHGDDDDYMTVSTDAANAFNSYSRQKILQLLVRRVPMLA